MGSLQHRHDGVARLSFAGLVDGDDTIFPFLTAFLVHKHDFAFYCHAGVLPRVFGPLTVLNLVVNNFAIVDYSLQEWFY